MELRRGHASPRARSAAAVIAIACGSAAALSSAAAPVTVGVPRIAGVLALTGAIEERWPWSGAWLYPIGDSLDFRNPLGVAPAYRVNRGIAPRTADSPGHQGADLANGRAGDRVRAAAHGVVACARRHATGRYGAYVVLAHHLDDGRLVYTVYAHLLRRSVAVRDGDVVRAGQAIGRVGRTGRATTPHLHFEVRVPTDSTRRWELCDVVDPVAFVRHRLATARDDTLWSTPYLAWAELSALVPRGIAADAPMNASLLHGIMARAVAGRELEALHEFLVADGRDSTAVGWDRVSLALEWLGNRARVLVTCPAARDSQELRRDARGSNEGLGSPADSLAYRSGVPLVADVCLALTRLAPEPPPERRRPVAATPD